MRPITGELPSRLVDESSHGTVSRMSNRKTHRAGSGSEDEAHFFIKHRLARLASSFQYHGDVLCGRESVSFVKRAGVEGALEVGGGVLVCAALETPLQ